MRVEGTGCLACDLGVADGSPGRLANETAAGSVPAKSHAVAGRRVGGDGKKVREGWTGHVQLKHAPPAFSAISKSAAQWAGCYRCSFPEYSRWFFFKKGKSCAEESS